MKYNYLIISGTLLIFGLSCGVMLYCILLILNILPMKFPAESAFSVGNLVQRMYLATSFVGLFFSIKGIIWSIKTYKIRSLMFNKNGIYLLLMFIVFLLAVFITLFIFTKPDLLNIK